MVGDAMTVQPFDAEDFVWSYRFADGTNDTAEFQSCADRLG
jgi:hypothetical protein